MKISFGKFFSTKKEDNSFFVSWFLPENTRPQLTLSVAAFIFATLGNLIFSRLETSYELYRIDESLQKSSAIVLSKKISKKPSIVKKFEQPLTNLRKSLDASSEKLVIHKVLKQTVALQKSGKTKQGGRDKKVRDSFNTATGGSGGIADLVGGLLGGGSSISSTARGKVQVGAVGFSASAGGVSERVLIVRFDHVADYNTEEYAYIEEGGFKTALETPLSTFSIDVDRASYSMARSYLNRNQLPPQDAVRIEEFINYFDYDYAGPTDQHPFAVHLELSESPWNAGRLLAKIGVQGKKVEKKDIPPSNLVFLIDVSGSMGRANKLPLLQKSFPLLVNNLKKNDRVAIVVYAGAAGLVLPSTPVSRKDKILRAIFNLRSGGSTAGGQGILLAYEIARKNFIKKGNNRVILATDGDFNIGVSSTGALTKLIEEKRKEGVQLSVLGFGNGNYKDSRMESLADKGDGNYAYIDDLLEARKVLVQEMAGTIFRIAGDVKLQVEFNPARVKSYCLVGYENRTLAARDFNDDKKDAGELGAGHTVTALYELVPAGSEEDLASMDPLKYQKRKLAGSESAASAEWFTVKLRYKRPGESRSQLLSRSLNSDAVSFSEASRNLRFASSVATFGMLLRGSEHLGTVGYKELLAWIQTSRGRDDEGYRSELMTLVKKAQLLSEGESENRVGMLR